MRFIKNIRIVGIFFLFFLSTGNVISQNIMQEEPGERIREIAKEKINMWIKELSLSSKQAELMEKKIIEYTMKRDELMQSKMNEDAKLERLVSLQALEVKDMRDILTLPQHQKYMAMSKQRLEKEDPGMH